MHRFKRASEKSPIVFFVLLAEFVVGLRLSCFSKEHFHDNSYSNFNY